jgi:hypothetical protein
MAERFRDRYGAIDMNVIDGILNAKWLHPTEHQALLSRILFTSDLKWSQSIYMPQRFWEAASAGCINVLPSRTTEQAYFPEMVPGLDYLTYKEDMSDLGDAYKWIQPGEFQINTNLLKYIYSFL